MTVAVVFISTRTEHDEVGYADMTQRMEDLAAVQPGFLGIDSVREGTGEGITVSFWADDSSARAWKQIAEHLHAQLLGRQRWYSQYRVVVAEVIRDYSGPQ